MNYRLAAVKLFMYMVLACWGGILLAAILAQKISGKRES